MKAFNLGVHGSRELESIAFMAESMAADRKAWHWNIAESFKGFNQSPLLSKLPDFLFIYLYVSYVSSRLIETSKTTPGDSSSQRLHLTLPK